MKKCSDTSPYFYSGWCPPKGFWTDMKKEIHHIKKSIFFECFLIPPSQVSGKETETLEEGYEKIFY